MDYREQIVHGNEELPVAIYRLSPNHIRYRMHIHWHPEHEILYVESGELQLRLNDTSYHLYAGDVIFIGGGTIHSAEPIQCRYTCILVNLSLLLKKSDSCMNFATRLQNGSCEIQARLSVASPHFAALCQELQDAFASLREGYAFEVKAAIFSFFGEILNQKLYEEKTIENQPNRQIAQRIKIAIAHMEQHYATPLRLEELAALANMTPNHFCRCFKSVTGLTPISYLINYRLSMAQYAIKTTDLPITHIALDCGFNDVSYFISAFRKAYHLTPKHYRKANLHEE